MSRRAYLHVGTPKSGTSYLQDKLDLNRSVLHEQGLDYVRTRTGDHFEAALDLIGERWAGEGEKARGQWDLLVAEAGDSRRDVLVSHEILAAARPDAVTRALASFPGHEVHLVLTARDLGRQVPAEWQERVKHRGRRDYTQFLERLHRKFGATDRPMWFWRVQHLPDILTRWGAALPPERVHLVTVPQSGAPRNLLWDRFAGVLGLDSAQEYAASETTNESLGGAEVTLLRLLNIELAARKVPRATYVEWVRERIVKEVLAGRNGSERTTVPPDRRPWIDAITETWVEQIASSGIDIVGDLEDLCPVWPDHSEPWPDPDDADPTVVADAAVQALAHVLDEIGTSRSAARAVARLARRLRG